MYSDYLWITLLSNLFYTYHQMYHIDIKKQIQKNISVLFHLKYLNYFVNIIICIKHYIKPGFLKLALM